MKKKRHVENILKTLIVAFSVVAFWRGIWGLMDLYFFPNNPALSFSLSAVLGILILYFTKHMLKDLI